MTGHHLSWARKRRKSSFELKLCIQHTKWSCQQREIRKKRHLKVNIGFGPVETDPNRFELFFQKFPKRKKTEEAFTNTQRMTWFWFWIHQTKHLPLHITFGCIQHHDNHISSSGYSYHLSASTLSFEHTGCVFRTELEKKLTSIHTHTHIRL